MVNTNSRPGLLNTNQGPGPLNTNWWPGPGPGAKQRAGGQEMQIPFYRAISNFQKKAVPLLTKDFFPRNFHSYKFFHERVSCVKNGT